MSVIQELTTSSGNCDKQARLIYNPVNDTFFQANEAVGTKNVGERRSDNVTDTGNKKISYTIKDKNKGTNKKTLFLIGTEFLVNQPNDTADPVVSGGMISQAECTSGTNSETANQNTSTSPVQSTASRQNSTEIVTNGTVANSPRQSTSASPYSPQKTPPVTPGLDNHTSSDESSNATGEFSSSSDSEQQPKKKPQHEQIDQRIKLQKEIFWKKIGKNTDPRIAALVPIHAPKMERLSRLQALKQRASMKPKPREGDIVTGIMHEIDKTAEINNSVAPVGAEFVIHELGATKNRVTVTATNSPLTVRPRPPKTKQKRQDKVLPFPQRRGSAHKNQRQQESGITKGGGDNESDTRSDASWPTDQDEATPSFRNHNNKRKTVRKASIKNKEKLGKKKNKIVKKPKKEKPKKLTKTAITNMVYRIRDPVPMPSWDTNLKLEAAKTRKL